jgi:hypothetical protein
VRLGHGSRIAPLARLSGMTVEGAATVAWRFDERVRTHALSIVMVVLGTTIYEFACRRSISPNETRGWQGQALP